jgi:hypothetical protein
MRERAEVAVLPAESVTWTGKMYELTAADTGVEASTPPDDNENPPGRGLKKPGAAHM